MFYPDHAFPDDKIVVFYGCGFYSRYFTKRYCIEEKVFRMPDFFCDDALDVQTKTVCGRPVISSEQLFAMDVDSLIVVSMAMGGGNLAMLGKQPSRWCFADLRTGRSLEMRLELKRRKANGELQLVRSLLADEKSALVFDYMTTGLADGAIFCRNIYEPNPYFNNDVIRNPEGLDVYVDAGAFPGDQVASFRTWNPGHVLSVAFEPNIEGAEIVRKRFHDKRFDLRIQGLANENGVAYFDPNNLYGARIAEGEKGNATIETVRLDDAGIERVSLLKMDIEGAEAAALRGAENIIRDQRPKLAVSVYHYSNDIFDIPLLVKSLRGDYALFLRQHSCYTCDTVLYAI